MQPVAFRSNLKRVNKIYLCVCHLISVEHPEQVASTLQGNTETLVGQSRSVFLKPGFWCPQSFGVWMHLLQHLIKIIALLPQCTLKFCKSPIITIKSGLQQLENT
ncbi:hypothetical protein AMECASPLE_025664 [Ameca splendens]|uniref:Uncharacterized protein n=1 Tax=Ameca splendens TaxID=208324 RepID=A0ABV1AC60_9TELE